MQWKKKIFFTGLGGLPLPTTPIVGVVGKGSPPSLGLAWEKNKKKTPLEKPGSKKFGPPV